MPRDTTRRRVLAGGAAALATSLAGCSGLTPFIGKRQERTRTLPVDDAQALVVDTELGDVTVRTADRTDVHVRIVKQSSSVTADIESLRFDVDRGGGRLRLFSKWTGEESRFGSRPSMDLTVEMPASLPLERVTTGAGDVDAADVTGAAVDGSDPALDVGTNAGDVTLRRVTGDVAAEASVGDLTLRDVDGTVTVQAKTGDVEVRSPGALGDVRATTGDVTVDVPALDGDTRVGTKTGDVDAAVATDLGVDLLAAADVGDVSVSGLSLSNASRTERRVSGVVDGGGDALTLRTDTGDVSVTALD